MQYLFFSYSIGISRVYMTFILLTNRLHIVNYSFTTTHKSSAIIKLEDKKQTNLPPLASGHWLETECRDKTPCKPFFTSYSVQDSLTAKP